MARFCVTEGDCVYAVTIGSIACLEWEREKAIWRWLMSDDSPGDFHVITWYNNSLKVLFSDSATAVQFKMSFA